MISISGVVAATTPDFPIYQPRRPGIKAEYMGHYIFGFIARSLKLREAAVDLPGSKVVPLSLGFGFIPLTDQLASEDEPAPFDHLERLTLRLGAWAERASRAVPIAYVETDYHGGIGSQAAMVWVSGHPAFGPVVTSDLRQLAPTPLLDGAINQAVRLIGVDRGPTRDEFDALGLGDHRSNESWLAAVAE